ncbi:MAG TPA: FHA domain-containing protein [Ktedonobacterales bacterium]|nr:FHA domain-containing protein [Ktedonobacterales bacterium]
MTCPMCKRVNEEGARFCPGCGRLLVEPGREMSSNNAAPTYGAQGSAFTRWGESDPAMVSDATRARVIIRSAPGDGEGGADIASQRIGEFALEGRTVTIGRTQGCDITFDGDTLTSRRHATLQCDDNQYVVTDLGSSNGTFVNDLEIREPTPLRHGDRVLIGQHELLFLLDQPRALVPQEPQPPLAEGADDASEGAPVAQRDDEAQPGSGVRQTAAPVRAGATAKMSSVAQLASTLAASASRLAAPPVVTPQQVAQRDDAELDAIRKRLLEASEALTRQAGLQSALAERRRVALVEMRERVADLLADLRGDDVEANSPVHHHPQMGLLELVDSVATDPNNLERLRALAYRADEVAQALRVHGPSEDKWTYERDLTIRGLEDILFRLRELS